MGAKPLKYYAPFVHVRVWCKHFSSWIKYTSLVRYLVRTTPATVSLKPNNKVGYWLIAYPLTSPPIRACKVAYRQPYIHFQIHDVSLHLMTCQIHDVIEPTDPVTTDIPQYSWYPNLITNQWCKAPISHLVFGHDFHAWLRVEGTLALFPGHVE